MADIDTVADTETAEKPAATPEQNAVVRAIGRAMWRSELAANATVEDRKTSWSEGRRKYMSGAKRLLRAMEKQGVVVTVTEKATDDATDAETA